jgi:hypothetical protein
VIAIAYPRGTLCALAGIFLVLGYYLRAERMASAGRTAEGISIDYLPDDSRYWTSRPRTLIGIGLSALCLVASSLADGGINDPWEWGFRPFGALAGAGAFAMLLLGCIFLWRHWREAIDDLREPRDMSRQFTQHPDASERYAMAPMRGRLLKEGLIALSAVLFVVWVAKQLGIVPERLLENPVVEAIISHVVWIIIVAFLILLWTTRSRMAVIFRMAVMLIFSLIILSGGGYFVFWVAAQTAPVLVALCMGIVALNFVFFYRMERAAEANERSSAPASSTRVL